MTTTLATLNDTDSTTFASTLGGIYEHSSWIPERTAAARPFRTLAALKFALQSTVSAASEAEQLSLIRAHPELAGKAMLTTESTGEQAAAGLHLCSPDEYATLQQCNADYQARFDFPFIIAVKGPDGTGLPRAAIIAAFMRRLRQQRSDEIAENLRQIHRIAELRLNDLLDCQPLLGQQIMGWSDTLGAWSDDASGLTCAYLTSAHRKTAAQLLQWMQDAGMDARIDAVGNVVGVYRSTNPQAKTLMTGSHYDTVRNGGTYDGREGILLPIAVIRHLHERGETLPFHLEVIGFAEEEGVRYKSTFLGSNAITGHFDMSLLARADADGITMRDALEHAGHDFTQIAAIARHPSDYLGFIEVHIEQGPVLLQRNLPVGIVTSIAGSSRYQLTLTGVASHAGTTPMTMRKDAAAAAAEIILAVEQRCGNTPSLVGTVGQLQVPNGSVNVIPGMCHLSLDIRAAEDAVREAAVADILHTVDTICARRQVDVQRELTMRAAAAPCAPWLMQQLSAATERAGVPAFELLSGAGHDAMALVTLTDIAMLFTRCGNGGISHNPLETMTADDAELSAQILLDFLRHFTPKT